METQDLTNCLDQGVSKGPLPLAGTRKGWSWWADRDMLSVVGGCDSRSQMAAASARTSWFRACASEKLSAQRPEMYPVLAQEEIRSARHLWSGLHLHPWFAWKNCQNCQYKEQRHITVTEAKQSTILLDGIGHKVSSFCICLVSSTYF